MHHHGGHYQHHDHFTGHHHSHHHQHHHPHHAPPPPQPSLQTFSGGAPHAKERWDPVLKKHVKPKTAKVTMIIGIIGEPATPLAGAAAAIDHQPEISGDPQLVMV